jgi:hypothetical protein
VACSLDSRLVRLNSRYRTLLTLSTTSYILITLVMSRPEDTEPPTPTDTSLATSIYSSKPRSETEAEQRASRAANWRFSTLCAAVEGKDQYGASSTPIYQTATFKGMDGAYDYTRSGNPTRGGLGESDFKSRITFRSKRLR